VNAPAHPPGIELDNDSQHAFSKLCADFVFHAGTARAVCIRDLRGMPNPARDGMAREGFLPFAKAHYGTLCGTDTKIVDGKPVTVPFEEDAGTLWWRVNTRASAAPGLGYPMKRIVKAFVFEPGVQSPADVFNVFDLHKAGMCAPNMGATLEDIRPLIDQLHNELEFEPDAVRFILNIWAHMYLHPAEKPPYAIVTHSKFSGKGKTMLVEILSRVFGPAMVATMPGAKLHSNFTDALAGKRILVVNELSKSDRADGYEQFKTQISEPTLFHERKGVAAEQITNAVNFLVTTNNPDCLPSMVGDRRLIVASTDKRPREKTYYLNLLAWMRGPGAPALAGVLATWDFGDWVCGEPAPQTAAAKQMQQAALPDATKFIQELFEDCRGPFDRDFNSIDGVQSTLATLYPHAGIKFTPKNVENALRHIGGEARQMKTGAGKGRFWFWRNPHRWLDASPAERSEHLVTGVRPAHIPGVNDDVETAPVAVPAQLVLAPAPVVQPEPTAAPAPAQERSSAPEAQPTPTQAPEALAALMAAGVPDYLTHAPTPTSGRRRSKQEEQP